MSESSTQGPGFCLDPESLPIIDWSQSMAVTKALSSEWQGASPEGFSPTVQPAARQFVREWEEIHEDAQEAADAIASALELTKVRYLEGDARAEVLLKEAQASVRPQAVSFPPPERQSEARFDEATERLK